ncbi:MAG: HAD family hydrolase [Candidatus ainarchaeum sp.]|nr:HAD family hydrolase [Candidatus ainarchaeum sp.]
MIKLIVFDLWRTLIPATIDFNHLFSLTKKNFLTKEEFLKNYERATHIKNYSSINELKKDFFLAFNGIEKSTLDKMFYEIYFNRFDKIHFFPDVEKNLTNLKNSGYKLALLSNTESLLAGNIEQKLSLNKYFDFLGYSFNIRSLKPNKEAFLFVLKKFGVEPFESLMVGDSLRTDIFGAKKVGMYSVLVNRNNFILDNANVKPDFEIKSFNEIEKVLNFLNKKKVTKNGF